MAGPVLSVRSVVQCTNGLVCFWSRPVSGLVLMLLPPPLLLTDLLEPAGGWRLIDAAAAGFAASFIFFVYAPQRTPAAHA
jgi:hypothetical protein